MIATTRIGDLSPERAAAFIATLSDADALELEHDWSQWARPAQLPPAGDWLTWLLLGGRGSGKTRAAAEWVLEQVAAGARRLALIGRTSSDVRDVMIEGESGILRCAHPAQRPAYEPSKRRLTWRNGAIATTYSAEEPDVLRGPQHDAAWCDELATYAQPDVWSNLKLGLRLGSRPRVVVTTTPRPTRLMKEILADPTTAVTRMTTYDNLAHLAPTFRDSVLAKYEGTRLGRQELNAEMLEEVEGALWTLDLIERSRMTEETFAKAPTGRTVVAVDPSVSSKADADETGIIAVTRGAGLCPCGLSSCFYVRTDASGTMPPVQWARTAVGLYTALMADRIVAEVNNGGDLVEAQLRVIDPNAAYRAVYAAKAKRTRAEPIAALYEQGRVHHVGLWPQLEDELCTWAPNSGMPSPGRLDALVWAITEQLGDVSVENAIAMMQLLNGVGPAQGAA